MEEKDKINLKPYFEFNHQQLGTPSNKNAFLLFKLQVAIMFIRELKLEGILFLRISMY